MNFIADAVMHHSSEATDGLKCVLPFLVCVSNPHLLIFFYFTIVLKEIIFFCDKKKMTTNQVYGEIHS